ncbi:MAG TPA: prolyl oligopeptidase family serine peptidase [Dyella sp.]|uniref:carboxylesterase family protein n=1 Tax=Dyella sp. TaxID=1869338 RepID=UPI002F91D0C8
MIRRLALLLLLLTTASVHAEAQHFVERKLNLDGHTYRYQVFVPAGWTAKREWPVVLFLHGSGERGADNQKQMTQGLPPWLRDHGADFPAVVVIPQAPDDTLWNGQSERMAMQALRESVKAYRGDKHRVYLTGLSMGGYGSWQFAIDHPGVFAAAAIICGGIEGPADEPELKVGNPPAGRDPYGWVADRVGRLPVWIFHGSADTVVPPEGSRRMHAALEKRGTDVRFTEFPGVNHGSWVPAYATAELWPWMFSHKVAEPEL